LAVIAANTCGACATKGVDVSDKAFSDHQPRRSRQELIPEYKQTVIVDDCDGEDIDALQRWQGKCSETSVWKGISLHKGCKVLRVTGSGVSGRSTVEVGMPWTTREFTAKAQELKHPFDKDPTLPPSVASVIFTIATKGWQHVAKLRRDTLQHYTSRAQELSEPERKLHQQLHPDVEQVVSNKRILLFKEMLRDIGYDDMAVVDLLVQGIKVVGELDRVGIWRPAPKGPKVSMPMLLAGARQAQSKILRDACRGGKAQVDKDLWECTLDEVESGCLRGPLSPEELSKRLGNLWIPARRFGIVQNGKLRPIDDFSEFLVNAAFGANEKVSLKGVDQIVAWSRAWIEAVALDGSVRLVDTAGKVWQGSLHKSWTQQSWKHLVGRVADLKSAYKQLPRHPAHACFSVVAVRRPDGTAGLFEALSMMFGETAAVYAFLRFSRAIAAIAAQSFSLLLIEFFDDFTQVEAQALSSSAQQSLEGLIQLLGWKLAVTDEKRKDFNQVFVSLGVQVDFTETDGGCVVLRNKPGRVEALRDQVESITLKPPFLMGFKEALSLRGKLAYAEGQTYERVAAAAVWLLSQWSAVGPARPISEEMAAALHAAVSELATGTPKRIGPKQHHKPCIVFLDGAFEASASIGGVLFDGDEVECFGAVVSSETVKAWKSKAGQMQVIGQAELFPALVARLTWSERLEGRRVIYFIDNESARQALVRAYSPVLPSLKIILQCSRWDAAHRSKAWYARVPTVCNIADGPSRMSAAEVCSDWGAKVVAPIFPDGQLPIEVLS